MKHTPRKIHRLVHDKQLTVDKQFKKQLMKDLMEGDEMAQSKKNLFTKFNRPATAGVVVALLVVGGASALYTSNHKDKQQLRGIEIPTNIEDVVPVSTIQTKASEGLVAGVSITGIELESEDGLLVYKVKFSDGSFKLFNAKTGELVLNTMDGLETDESVPVNFVAGISLQQARQTAQDQFPGKTITKIELETEEGVVVYSVRFSDDSRVDVNASDGSVIRVRNETTSNSGSGSGDSSDDSGGSSDDDSSGSDDSDDNNSGSGSGNSGGSNSGSGNDND